MKINHTMKSFLNLGVVIMLAFFLSGCFGDTFSTKPEDGQTSGAQPKSRKTTAVYYDFEDVLIPMELKIVKDRKKALFPHFGKRAFFCRQVLFPFFLGLRLE